MTKTARSRALSRRWVLGLAGLGAAIAGSVALYVIQPPQEVLVADLAPAGRNYRVIASFLVGRDTLRLARTAGAAAPPGRVTQVWAIGADGEAVSLGLVPAQASWRVTLPPNLLANPDALTIALSDEAAQAAVPTLPYLATAPLNQQRP